MTKKIKIIGKLKGTAHRKSTYLLLKKQEKQEIKN